MEKRDVCMLNNIHDMPQEENLCNKQGNAITLEIVKDYNHHMGYVEKDDRITNTYSISHCPWNWTQSCFSICLFWTFGTVTSFFLQVMGRKFHTDFQLALLRNRLEVTGQEWGLQRHVRRPPTSSAHIGRLDTSFKKHWPGAFNPGHCCVCSVRGVK